MITVRAQTAHEEFEYIWSILNNLSFYQEHNYSVNLPDNSIVDWNISIKDINKDYYKEIFINKIYSSSFYIKGIEKVQKVIPTLEKILEETKFLNEKWGFKLFPNYLLLLTQYGSGGSYNSESGTILMLTSKDGCFKRGNNPLDTIVHEIIHIGIEEIIVQKYNLSHIEKENLVDWIIINYLEKYLPDYRVQNFKRENISHKLTKQALGNLPKVIKNIKT